MSWKWLNQIWAQLQLLVEELKDCGGIEQPLLIAGRLCSRQLSVSFCVTGVGGAAAGGCARAVLGGVRGGWGLGELRHELFEKKLSIVEATVVRDVHGHPETHGGQLIVEKLKGKNKKSYASVTKRHICFKHPTWADLDVAPGHMLQYPDAMGPSIVVAGITAGGVTADLHLIVKRPGQLVIEHRAPLQIWWLHSTVLLLAPTGCRREPLQDLLKHPASAATQPSH